MGRVILSGASKGMTKPTVGTPISELAVGSTVKLSVNGTVTDFLIVNQGIPSNSILYDDSCNGTWLLMKDIYENRQWNTSNANEYETSAINIWLNGDFFSSLGSVEQATVKQIKIPYRAGGGDGGANQSGANGLSCKVFLLSGPEVGLAGENYMPNDGAKLDYFNANTGTDSKRIAYLNGSAAFWWLRSPYTRNDGSVWRVYSDGDCGSYYTSVSLGIRPALVLPSTALFDASTSILKGVA